MEAHPRYRPYSAPKLKGGQQKQQAISLLLMKLFVLIVRKKCLILI